MYSSEERLASVHFVSLLILQHKTTERLLRKVVQNRAHEGSKVLHATIKPCPKLREKLLQEVQLEDKGKTDFTEMLLLIVKFVFLCVNIDNQIEISLT